MRGALNLGSMIAEAKARAGYSSLGNEFDPEPFERLIKSVNEEAGLSSQGVAAFPEFIIHALENRLEIEEWYRRHPEIKDEEIVAPIFGVGLPRTGSTLLVCLMALDPDTRSIRLWESEKPCLPPVANDSSDPRMAESAARRRQSLEVSPELLPTIPYTGPNNAVECYEIFFMTALYSSYESFVHCPSFSEWIFGPKRDFSPAYRYHKRTLKLLQWRCPPKRWSLKMPNHSLTIADLRKVYPDSRFVMTHRDPAKSIPSTAHVNVAVRRAMLEDPGPLFVGAQMVEHWAVTIERLLAFRETKERLFFDIDHAALLSDSRKQIEILYDWLGWKTSESYLKAVGDFRTENPKGLNRVNPSDYEIDIHALRQRFQFYFDRFPSRD